MKFLDFLRKLNRSKNGIILIVIVTTIYVISQLYLFITSTFDEQSSKLSLGIVTNGPICLNEPCLRDENPLFNFPNYCHNISKETFSSLERTKTEECRNYIVDTYCTHFIDALYPNTLPYTCVNKAAAGFKGEYLGCYRDDFNDRLFNEYNIHLGDNSPINCIHHCGNAGFLYAGVQFKIECFCSSTLNRIETKFLISNANCSYLCPESHNQNIKIDKSIKFANRCGGYLSLQIYATGIGPRIFKPIEYNPNLNEKTNKTFKSQRIVFLLTIAGRSVRQVIRLISRIYRKHHFYFIHVDARQDYLYNELQLLFGARFENIQFSKQRWATIWGGASLLRMVIGCLDDLVRNFSHWQWDYVLNLSESDYPIKKVEEVENFLEQNIGFNFLRSHEKDTPRFIKRQGMDMLFVECDEHMYRLGRRKVQNGIRVDGGSDWVALHKSFISYFFTNADPKLISWLITKNAIKISQSDYLHRYYTDEEKLPKPKFNPLKDINEYKLNNDASNLQLKQYPVEFNKEKIGINNSNFDSNSVESKLINGMIHYWSYSLLPVESFFHTLLHNGAMCNKAINNNLHMTNWKRSRGCKCQHKHVVDWCGCSPNVFLEKDIDRLISIKNRPDFFARKFDPSVDLKIINFIDEQLLDIHLRDFPSLNSHWENIFHFLDSNSKAKEFENSHINSLTALLKHSQSCLPWNLFPVEAFVLFIAGKYQGVVVTFEVEVSEQRLLKSQNFNRTEDFPNYFDIFKPVFVPQKSYLKADYFLYGDTINGESKLSHDPNYLPDDINQNLLNGKEVIDSKDFTKPNENLSFRNIHNNYDLILKGRNVVSSELNLKIKIPFNVSKNTVIYKLSNEKIKQKLDLKRHKRDIFKKHSSGKIYLQALFKFIRPRKLYFNESSLSRFLWAEVGVNFDPKELIFRNYAGFYGPESDIGIMVSWGGKDNNEDILICRVLDPDGLMVVEKQIGPDQSKATVTHESFDLVRPLKVGIWSVIFGDGEKWFSSVLHFLIHEAIKLKFDEIQIGNNILTYKSLVQSNNQINLKQDLNIDRRQINSMNNKYKRKNENLRLVSKAKLNKEGQHKENINSSLSKNLLDFFEFWQFKKACINDNIENECDFQICNTLPWSNFYPDPKIQWDI